jgi:hypothetical protein
MIDPKLFNPPGAPPPEQPLTWRGRVGLVAVLSGGCAIAILLFCALILGLSELARTFAQAMLP